MTELHQCFGVGMDDGATSDLRGAEVLILTGTWAGHEGVCLGKADDGTRYAVSPHDSDQILRLVFVEDFGLLVDSSADPKSN